MRLFQDTYMRLEGDMKEIARIVQSVPSNARPGTAHIDQVSALTQYAYYVSLVREWVPAYDATILDWGGSTDK